MLQHVTITDNTLQHATKPDKYAFCFVLKLASFPKAPIVEVHY